MGRSNPEYLRRSELLFRFWHLADQVTSSWDVSIWPNADAWKGCQGSPRAAPELKLSTNRTCALDRQEIAVLIGYHNGERLMRKHDIGAIPIGENDQLYRHGD